MSRLTPLPSVPTGATASLRQPGDVWSHAQCPAPAWTPSGNVCAQMSFAPDAWASGAVQQLLGQWSPTSPQAASFRVQLSAAGSLQFQNCGDGTTTTGATSITHAIGYSTLGSPANGSTLTIRVVRQSNNAGNTTTSFWVSTNYDPIAKTGTWTQKGTTQSTAGTTTIFNASTASKPPPLELGACQYGSNVVSGVLPLTGNIAWANLYDGTDDTGTLIAMVDNRTPWAGYEGTTGFYVDGPGNQWNLKGPAARWVWSYPVNQINTVQTQVPLSTRAGWNALTGVPLSMGATIGSALAVNVWRFAPFTLTQSLTIKGLAVETSTAASGGTSALQFAIFNADGSGGSPGTLNTDLVGQGTIDLTAAAGVRSMSLGTPLTLPAGNYWIGCMWQGTATTSPITYVQTGPHPAVTGTSAYARNLNGYTQTTSSVPNPAVATTATAATIIGYQQ